MKNLLFFLAFAGIMACSPAGEKAAETDLTGFETSNVKGTSVTYAVKKGADGKIIQEGYIRNGKKDGQWISYDASKGTVSVIESYIDGNLNGYTFKVSSRGYLDEQMGFANNELNGLYAQYKYGRLKSEANYKDGKLDGISREYYDNGKLQQETEFKGGVQNGIYNYYSDDGFLRMSYTYKDGKKVEGGIVDVPKDSIPATEEN